MQSTHGDFSSAESTQFINHPIDFVSPLAFTQQQRWKKRQPDSYTTLQIQPGLKESEQTGHQLPVDIRLLPDIVCLPGQTWSKIDSTQRLTLTQFAARGQRVFYICPETFLKDDSSPRIRVRVVEPNVTEILLGISGFFDVQGGIDNKDTLKALLFSLAELITLYGIDECILYVSHPSWCRLAHTAQQKWGWRIVYDLAILDASSALQTQEHQFLLEYANLVIASNPEQVTGLDSKRLLVWNPERADWSQRCQAIYTQYAATVPLASIVIVTYNNLVYTQLCLESILRNTEYPNYEIIVVDNKSSDATPEYLRALEKACSNVRVISNEQNYGFAKGNNLGLEQARGEFLVLLNNDTIVPPGWLSRLLRHLDDPEVGMIGPRSNSVGNSAKIDVEYATWKEMEVFAQTNNWNHDNQVSNIHMLGMFCVALRRDVYHLVGPLDEQFGIGTFEDDDYCMRIRHKGYKLLCAFDAFVHHFGSATFKQYVNIPKIYEQNKLKFEDKWGLKWLSYENEVLSPVYHIKIDRTLSENEQNEFLMRNLTEYEKNMALLNQKLAQKDYEITSLTHEITSLTHEITSLTHEITSLTHEITSLNNQLLSIRMSFSWKITRPLRFLKRFIMAPLQAIYELLGYFWTKLPQEIRIKIWSKLQSLNRKIAIMKRLIKGLPLDLSWEDFQKKVLSQRHIYKGVFIQHSTIDWNVPLYQRPQHMSAALGRRGYLVIYIIPMTTVDDVNGFREVSKNVWVTNLSDLAISKSVYSVYSTSVEHATVNDFSNIIRKDRVFVYEYIDHISPQISGNDENIQRLSSLKHFAFQNADFVVASARLLEREAVDAAGKEKVLYIPNGVDVGHYRNPKHLTTPLPHALKNFRQRFSTLVGYFGAIAPWLWYEMLDELVKLRSDVGFVFFGVDYNNGVSHLPKGRENFLYLGPVEYKILPAHARLFDICFIPFAPGEIARTTSPLKLFEYFALEKPVVVTSFMDECIAFPEVFFGDSVITISKAIDEAAKVKDNSEYKDRLALLAEQNSWDERAKQYESIFSSVAKNT